MIRNRASRNAGFVVVLVWLFGIYGAAGHWPPSGLGDVLLYVAIVGLPVLFIRGFRARIVVDEKGLVSCQEAATVRLTWSQISKFSTRGRLIQNQVGAELINGKWVVLQYHPFAPDIVMELEGLRAQQTVAEG